MSRSAISRPENSLSPIVTSIRSRSSASDHRQDSKIHFPKLGDFVSPIPEGTTRSWQRIPKKSNSGAIQSKRRVPVASTICCDIATPATCQFASSDRLSRYGLVGTDCLHPGWQRSRHAICGMHDCIHRDSAVLFDLRLSRMSYGTDSPRSASTVPSVDMQS